MTGFFATVYDDDDSYYFDQNITATTTLNEMKDGNALNFNSFTIMVWLVSIWLFVMGLCIFQLKQLETQNERQRMRLQREETIRAAKIKTRFDPETRGNMVTSNILTRKIKSRDNKGRIEFSEPFTAPKMNVSSNYEVSTTDAIVGSDPNQNRDNVFLESPDKNKDEHFGLTCSICLDSFELGHAVSWSRKLKCKHFFHSDCLVTWLMNHDDCPICRKVLIEDVDRLGDDGSKRKNRSISSCANKSSMEEKKDYLDSSSGIFFIVNGLISYIQNPTHSTFYGKENDHDNDILSCNAEDTPHASLKPLEGTHNIDGNISNRLKEDRKHRKTGNKRYDAIDDNDNIV